MMCLAGTVVRNRLDCNAISLICVAQNPDEVADDKYQRVQKICLDSKTSIELLCRVEKRFLALSTVELSKLSDHCRGRVNCSEVEGKWESGRDLSLASLTWSRSL